MHVLARHVYNSSLRKSATACPAIHLCPISIYLRYWSNLVALKIIPIVSLLVIKDGDRLQLLVGHDHPLVDNTKPSCYRTHLPLSFQPTRLYPCIRFLTHDI